MRPLVPMGERPEDPAVGQVVAEYRQALARHLGALTGGPAEDRSQIRMMASTT